MKKDEGFGLEGGEVRKKLGEQFFSLISGGIKKMNLLKGTLHPNHPISFLFNLIK